MFNIDLSWIVGAVTALALLIGGWRRARSAKEEGVAQGRAEVIKEVEKADEKRAKEIRERVEAVHRPAVRDTGIGMQSSEPPQRTDRGYRD